METFIRHQVPIIEMQSAVTVAAGSAQTYLVHGPWKKSVKKFMIGV